MIEPIEGAPPGVLAFKAVGKVEAADYEQVLTPAIDKAIAGGGKVRLVYELGQEYDGYSVGAAWEDMKLWTPHLRSWGALRGRHRPPDARGRGAGLCDAHAG